MELDKKGCKQISKEVGFKVCRKSSKELGKKVCKGVCMYAQGNKIDKKGARNCARRYARKVARN